MCSLFFERHPYPCSARSHHTNCLMRSPGSVVMYAAVASMDGTASSSLAAVFVLVWLFISKIVLFDLFVVMIMQYFSVSETINIIKAPGRMESLVMNFRYAHVKFFSALSKAGENRVFSYEPTELLTDSCKFARSTNMSLITRTESLAWKSNLSLTAASVLAAANQERSLVFYKLIEKSDPYFEEGSLDASDQPPHSNMTNMTRSLFGPTPSSLDKRRRNLRGLHARKKMSWRALLSWGDENIFHQLCLRLEKDALFGGFMYSCIFCSCLLLISTPPATDIPGQNPLFSQTIMDLANFIFTIIFTFEMLVYMCAQVISL